MVSVVGQPHRRVSYGELAGGANIVRTLQGQAILRSASQFQVMGTSAQRLDGREKVTGAARYAADIRVPGMLYARLLRPPSHGATLQQIDTSAAEQLPGISVVNRKGLIAVLHADPEAAEEGLRRIKAQWQVPLGTLAPDSIHAHLVSQAAPMKVLAQRGDLEAARISARLFEQLPERICRARRTRTARGTCADTAARGLSGLRHRRRFPRAIELPRHSE